LHTLEIPIPAASTAATYCFGPFTIHADERLLRRGNDVVPLPPKLVATLLLLLESPGDLVTKEDLRQHVWNGDFVEENTITQTVSRLRRLFAAEFPGENPLQVISKRGYRFGIPVAVTYAGAPEQSSAPPVATAPAPVPYAGPYAGLYAGLYASPNRSTRFGLALAVAGLLAIALVSFAFFTTHKRSVPLPTDPGRPSVAVLGFEDLSPDAQTAWIGTALSEMTYTELGANQKLRMVPNGVVAQMRRQTTLPHTMSLSPATLAALGNSLNCSLVLAGQYLESDGKIRIDAVLQNAQTGETVGTFTRTDTSDHLLALTALLGEALRSRLGEGNLSPQQSGQIVAAAATNPEALRAYAQGMASLREMDPIAAQPQFEKAIQIEPKYPLAHAGLSQTWSLLGYDARAREEARRASELTSGLSREEQLQVEARSDETSSLWDKAVEADLALWRFFPDNIEYGLALVHAMTAAGKPQRALEIVNALHRLPAPQNADPSIALREAEADMALSQFAASEKASAAAIQQARSRKDIFVLGDALLAHGQAANHLGQPSVAQANFTEAANAAEASGDLAMEVRALHANAELSRQHGDIDTAKQDNNRAIDIANRIGDRRDLIAVQLSMTQVYRPEGNLAMQKQFAEQALQLATETSDKSAQMVALLDLGNVNNNEGDSESARNRYERSAALAREVGDREMLSKVTGNLAILEYTHGHLASAQTLLEQAISISRSIGDKASTAYKLGHYATVLTYENHLPEARAALNENCQIEAQLQERLSSASCQVAMGRLSMTEGRPADAVAILTQVIATCKDFNPLLDAWETLADAQLDLGNTTAAADAVQHAEQMGGKTKNPAAFKIPMGLVIGRLQALTGHEAEGLRTLRASQQQATALKLLPIELRAKLLIAEIDSMSQTAIGLRELAEVRSEANAAGFNQIAAAASRQNELLRKRKSQHTAPFPK
jgi:DNA-binding winged helix-turn-helix (wHTH) protein/TolB-like protein